MMDGSLLLLGLSGPELTAAEAALFRNLQPAGYILAPRNVVTPQQTRKLTDDLRGLSNELPIIAIDPSGGPSCPTRAIAPAAPAATALAAAKDLGKIADAGAFTGDLLRLLGINLALGPVLDLDHFPHPANTPLAPRWNRDPQRVIDYAGQWNRWLRKRHVATCVKYFPAGGRATADPQHGFPSSPATLEELLREDVIPYTALMPELDAVMTGHVLFPNIDPDHPAAFSPRIVRRFLRDQLGFDRHLVLTDIPGAEADSTRHDCGVSVELAIGAGNDLAVIRDRTEMVEPAAHSIAGLPHWMTEEARDRVERFRRKKLHPPVTWSDRKWQAACEAMAKLAGGFPADSGEIQTKRPELDV
jgi:beta-N-acetylhexosaminidase